MTPAVPKPTGESTTEKIEAEQQTVLSKHVPKPDVSAKAVHLGKHVALEEAPRARIFRLHPAPNVGTRFELGRRLMWTVSRRIPSGYWALIFQWPPTDGHPGE